MIMTCGACISESLPRPQEKFYALYQSTIEHKRGLKTISKDEQKMTISGFEP